MTPKRERELIAKTRNTARYFVETRHVAWVLFVATLVFGFFSYAKMAKRKDPFVQVRVAVAVCAWPGASASDVEALVTRRLEEKIAQNTNVERIESTSRTGVSIVTVTLRESLPIAELGKTFDDIDLRLRAITDLPAGTLPVELHKDFGDTSTLMLTIASPRARAVEIEARARSMIEVLAAARAATPPSTREGRSAIVLPYPASLDATSLRRVVGHFMTYAQASGGASDLQVLGGPGWYAVDGRLEGITWRALEQSFVREEQSVLAHPEIWRSFVVAEPSDVEPALIAAAGDAYSHRELDDFTDAVARRLRALPTVAKVTRAGVVGERVYLDYSPERLDGAGMSGAALRQVVGARNIHATGGVVETTGRTLAIDPSGEYKSAEEIGDTLVTATSSGAPVKLRDLVDVTRDYETPLYTAFLTRRSDSGGPWTRTKAVTVVVQMTPGAQIGDFAREVNATLTDVTRTLPEDLIVSRTSDQAQQVEAKIDLFMTTLYEAIAILVVVGLVGFREWRSALVLAISIPLTLAMTFVLMYALGIDIQQMSIAALILALGLLVDDPVVAGDAIKHELDRGKDRAIAAWLGPTKLARAILFATITNIVAYLPFLLMSGDVGNFIYSLPIVMTCSLVASRVVSMTFIPLLGHVLLRPARAAQRGDTKAIDAYRRLVSFCIANRYRVLAASTAIFVVAGLFATRLRSSFFPRDLSHLFYVDVFLPEDAPLRATAETAAEVDRIIREVAEDPNKEVVRSIATFVGGGAPRFWYSLSPRQQQPSYAQLVVEVGDEHDTERLIAPIQRALTSRVPGARIDVRQLENGKPVPQPVEIRIAGDDVATLRAIAERAKSVLRDVEIAERVRDDWGDESFRLEVDVDGARAALAGVSNLDVATASAGFSGVPLNALRDGEKRIPIVARLRYGERGKAGDIENLYVTGAQGRNVPLRAVADVSYRFDRERIQRRDQRRTIAVSCFPTAGSLPSEVMSRARGRLLEIGRSLPPGYSLEIGGSEENVVKVQKESVVVGIVSCVAIFLTLVLQLKHALKPLIVFAAIPYGIAGAFVAIVVTGSPFGFTAILGVISLIGVIVSHIIVLFDYIEEAHARGEPLEKALLDAGAARLRPVLITVGATVLGLVPLAAHGGPLWEPLCYAQIGGLTVATIITPVLVPVLYAVVVLDLKWLAWETTPPPAFADHDSDTPIPAPPARAHAGPKRCLTIMSATSSWNEPASMRSLQ
ncbi:MAG: efflux RND transporter permease subunit [Labilithrix sp.]|nr:efflux RND transporter permease subunit [Labilithrix sp.]